MKFKIDLKFKIGNLQFKRFTRKRVLTFLSTLLVLVAASALFLRLTSPAMAAWWPSQINGTTWSHRQQLTLTNNSGDDLASTTTVAVTVNTKSLSALNKLQSDCDDLRIVYQPDSTTFTELSRYISYPGGGSCTTRRTSSGSSTPFCGYSRRPARSS